MFIGNFQYTYERPYIAETLKTIKQKHDKSLQDYVKHLCNSRNTISYIQDIEIINVFRNGVSDIKTIEEIDMKKPITMADLLTVIDVCIEAFEGQAWLLESRGKGPSKKKQDDQEVNTTNRGDHGDREDRRNHEDRRYRGNHPQQSSYQKDKRPFHRFADVEKRCEIHHTVGHDLKECKTFLDRKKM
jgi:hypothetical protein